MTLDFDDVLKLHLKKFGVEPVFTGIEFHDSENLIESIIESIEKGVPYVQKDVPEGALI